MESYALIAPEGAVLPVDSLRQWLEADPQTVSLEEGIWIICASQAIAQSHVTDPDLTLMGDVVLERLTERSVTVWDAGLLGASQHAGELLLPLFQEVPGLQVRSEMGLEAEATAHPGAVLFGLPEPMEQTKGWEPDPENDYWWQCDKNAY